VPAGPSVGRFADFVFASFLLLTFVGLEPFTVRDADALRTLGTGDGDVARQIGYLTAFTISAITVVSKRGLGALATVPVSVAAVLAWCFLSVTWAVDPVISFRRVTLTALVVATTIFNVESLGAARTLRTLRVVLAGILIVNWIGVLWVPQAVHLPGEVAEELLGDWRGLHAHKNTAGAISAVSALVFLFFAQHSGRWRDWLLVCGAVVFLILTQAKTSISLFGLTLVAGAIYRYGWRRPRTRRVVIAVFLAALATAVFAAVTEQSRLAQVFSDPALLTGRGAIWHMLLASVKEHPLGGVGYGSFWNIGAAMPLTMYGDNWVTFQVQGHNGYLDMLVQTGGIGLTLLVIGVVFVPLREFATAAPNAIQLRAFLFSLFTFAIFFNLTESSFFQRDRPEWVMFLVVLALMRQLEGAHEATRPRFARTAA
jgi:O-antigen ligase